MPWSAICSPSGLPVWGASLRTPPGGSIELATACGSIMGVQPSSGPLFPLARQTRESSRMNENDEKRIAKLESAMRFLPA